jgi:hypothetical protein
MTTAAGVSTSDYASPRRCSFLVLWLRFTVTLFLLGCVLGYLSRRGDGLAWAIGGGIVATPITGLIWASMFRLVQWLWRKVRGRPPEPEGLPDRPIQFATYTSMADPKPKPRAVSPTPTQQEDRDLYSQVGEELRTGQRQDAAWAKALIEADGDELKTRARYAKIRVEELRVSRAKAGTRG